MRVAVIGAGVAGLGAAWLLSHPSARTRHEVVVFEREQRFGGHSCTVDVETPQGSVPVDMGFIVFNQRNYPNLVALFEQLGVPTEDSNMSFAVSLDGGRFEYASAFSGFVAQRSNVLRPAFLRMTRDILRFNRLAPKLLERSEDLDFTIGHFISEAGFGEAFRDRYLLPMASCIWSTPLCRMLDYPAQTMARFFSNHGLLTIGSQLQWRTVSGGSRSYVERLVAPLRQQARLATPATRIRRHETGVDVRDAQGHWQSFDCVVLACHADQALALLDDADERERELLGRFAYSSNEVWLHGDASLMPQRRPVWSSWNYVAGSPSLNSDAAASNVSVTYWMNRLQNLAGPDLFVSVNPDREPDPATVHRRHTFEHPMFDSAAIRAQRELPFIQGVRRTFFCGSYAGYGFHEDALSAGLDVAELLGMPQRPATALPGSGTLLPPLPVPAPAAS